MDYKKHTLDKMMCLKNSIEKEFKKYQKVLVQKEEEYEKKKYFTVEHVIERLVSWLIMCHSMMGAIDRAEEIITHSNNLFHGGRNLIIDELKDAEVVRIHAIGRRDLIHYSDKDYPENEKLIHKMAGRVNGFAMALTMLYNAPDI